MGEPTNELLSKLQHREAVNEGTEAPQQKERVSKNVFLEFTEFTRKQIKDLEKKFNEFCSPDTKIIGLTELKVWGRLYSFVTLLLCHVSVYDGETWSSSNSYWIKSNNQGSRRGPRQCSYFSRIPVNIQVSKWLSINHYSSMIDDRKSF